MLLIVGLGNPTDKYKLNRHNIGFMVIEALVEHFALGTPASKFKSKVFEYKTDTEKIIFLKPQTYMNLSGAAVLAAMQFYKLSPEDIIVLHDDIYLKAGCLRYKINGGDGGQNGVKNIATSIGTNFHRIKIGVDLPTNPNMSISDYVLSNFSTVEINTYIIPLIETFKNNFNLLVSKDFNSFVQLHNNKFIKETNGN